MKLHTVMRKDDDLKISSTSMELEDVMLLLVTKEKIIPMPEIYYKGR